MRIWGVVCVSAVFVALPAAGQKTLTDGVKDLASQISASATKEQKQRIGILAFKELDGQTTVLGTYLAEELTTHLVNNGLKVVERQMLDKVLAEQKLQQTGAIDPDTAKRVGKVAGVDAIITGTVTDLQSIVGINTRVIDTSTGEIFAAAQVKITKDDDVKKIMATVLQRASAPTASRSLASPSLVWQNGPLRYSIDGLHGTGNTITTLITVENMGEEGKDTNVGPFWLIDENGDRWRGLTGEDSTWASTTIPPGTRRRFRWTFAPETSPNGTSFTLTDGENRQAFLRHLQRLP